MNYSAKNENTLQKYLDKFGVSWEGAENFLINKSFTQQTKEKNKIIAEYKNQLIKLEIITNLEKEAAEKHITNKRYVVDSLFLNIAAPYPDAITTTLECPDEFEPKIREIKISNFDAAYYEIFATERITYGACSDDLIKYKTILTWVYCENTKNLFQIELFVPKNEFNGDYNNLFNSFKCEK